MPKRKADAGMMAGADPTAPGGMSRKALAKELVEEHGWSKADLKQFEPMETWPLLINSVIEERRARELEREQERGTIQGLTPEERVALNEAHREAAEMDTGYDDDILAELDALLEEPVEQVSADDLPEGTPLFVGMPTTKDYIFDGHMGASPSGAERWLTCTASLAASRAFLETLTPNQQAQLASGGVAARQGTTAHAAAEAEALVVVGKQSPEEAEATLLELAIMPDTDGEAYDDEMAEYITEYLDLLKGYVDDRGEDHVLIEQTVEAVVELMTVDADGDPEVHAIRGSGDTIVLPTEVDPELVVVDLKYGEGIDVDVEQNPQVRIYALGALDLLADDEGNLITPVETVTYHIVQPRLGGVKTWTESLDDLLDWRDEVLTPALTEALGGLKAGAKFVPSAVACQWCPARGGCPALTEARIEEAAELFDVVTQAEYEDGPGSFPETVSLSNEQLGSLYAQIRGLKDIMDDLRAEAERRLYRGQEVPGFHLVNYSPPRKWREDAQDEIAAGIDGLSSRQRNALFREPTLVTPAAAEKLLGPEDYAKIKALVDKPDKRPVIAPVGDRRSAWEGRPPEQMFPDLSDEGVEEA